MNLYLMC